MKRSPLLSCFTALAVFQLAAAPVLAQLAAGALGLDPAFQSRGCKSFPAPMGSSVRALAEQPDGKLIAAGFEAAPGGYRLSVRRWLADGSPDSEFYWNFADYPGLGVHTYAAGITLQTDGRIVIAGANLDTNPPGEFELLLRMLPDGRPDSSFGGGKGFVTRLTSGRLLGVSQQSNGALVAVSSTRGLERFSSSGVPDLSFPSTRGPVVARPVAAPAFSEGGRVWVLSERDSGSLACYQPDGGGYLEFGGGDGIALRPVDVTVLPPDTLCTYSRVAPQSDGGVLLAGVAESETDSWLVVVRLLQNGTRDLTFGTEGVVSVAIPRLRRTVAGLFPQNDGSIVAVGNAVRPDSSSFEDIAVVRIGPAGAVDTACGPAGYGLISLQQFTWARDVTSLQLRSGAVMVAGSYSTAQYGGAPGIFVARLRAHPLAVRQEESSPSAGLDLSVAEVDFGVLTGGSASRQLVLTNTGAETLSNISLKVEGDARSTEFRLAPGAVATLTPGAEVPVVMTFSPGNDAAPREQILKIEASSGGGNSIEPLTVALRGRRATPLESWRYTWFGMVEPFNDAADNADFDRDGLANLLEYFSGGNPHRPDQNPIQVLREGDRVRIACIAEPAASGGIDAVLESASGPAGPWSPDDSNPEAEYGTGADGKPRVMFNVPAGGERRFYRMRLTVR